MSMNSTELKQLLEKAIAGDKEAQLKLGFAFEEAQSYKQALEWFRMAAAQGCAVAQNHVGYAYALGNGVEQDHKLACEWYRMAAEQGCVLSQHNLGLNYAALQNYDEAFNWYEKAAAQGYADAQCNLGAAYHNGQGVKQDYKKAHDWYKKAAAQGVLIAHNNLGMLHAQCNDVEGVEQDNKQACEWYRKAAELGYQPAKDELESMAKGGLFRSPIVEAQEALKVLAAKPTETGKVKSKGQSTSETKITAEGREESKASGLLFQHKKENWVIVRVWLPKKEGKFVTAHEAASGGNVGHVSLQTCTKDSDGNFAYASFWPDWDGVKKGGVFGAVLGQAKGMAIPNVEFDIILESRDLLTSTENKKLNELLAESTVTGDLSPSLKYLTSLGKKKDPDVVVVLNTLNVSKIDEALMSFCKSPSSLNWSLLGKNVFNVINNGGGQSCAGLVHDLLNAGGIKEMAKWDMVSSWWTVAPDAVARVAVEAASSQRELRSVTTLPPGINAKVVRPDYDLNPHTWTIGYYMGKPGKKFSA